LRRQFDILVIPGNGLAAPRSAPTVPGVLSELAMKCEGRVLAAHFMIR
jgi:hypothetical protein